MTTGMIIFYILWALGSTLTQL